MDAYFRDQQQASCKQIAADPVTNGKWPDNAANTENITDGNYSTGDF